MKTKLENLAMGTAFTDVAGRKLTLRRAHASEGVFVASETEESFQYLFAGVAEVTIDDPARTCRYCSKPVTHRNQQVDYCETCWWSGQHHSAQHCDLLLALQTIEGCDPMFEMVGGGCFNLSITMADGRFLCATESDGPGVPMEEGERWGHVTCWRSEEAFSEGRSEGSLIDSAEGAWDDSGVLNTIRKMIEKGA